MTVVFTISMNEREAAVLQELVKRLQTRRSALIRELVMAKAHELGLLSKRRSDTDGDGVAVGLGGEGDERNQGH